MEATIVTYGAGECAVCQAKTPLGRLMCALHWAQVPVEERRAVYDALRRWDSCEATLGDVRAAQEKAIEAVTGVRR